MGEQVLGQVEQYLDRTGAQVLADRVEDRGRLQCGPKGPEVRRDLSSRRPNPVPVRGLRGRASAEHDDDVTGAAASEAELVPYWY